MERGRNKGVTAEKARNCWQNEQFVTPVTCYPFNLLRCRAYVVSRYWGGRQLCNGIVLVTGVTGVTKGEKDQ